MSNYKLRSQITFEKLVKDFQFTNALDVGSGDNRYAEAFKLNNKECFTTDILESDYQGDFNNLDFGRKFECLWCAHVLEHQLNVNVFLKKCFDLLEDDGILAISVPPMKHEIVGGHLSLWNTGLLLYNLIITGFDCSEASVKTYGYDCSIIVKKKPATLPELRYDYGDIERLSQFFPFDARQGFNGQILELNW